MSGQEAGYVWTRNDRADHDAGHPSGFDCDGYALASSETCAMTARTPEPTEGTRMSESLSGEAVEALATALSNHVGVHPPSLGDPIRCVCGWKTPPTNIAGQRLVGATRWTHHRAHAAEALAPTVLDLIGQERARAEAAVRERVAKDIESERGRLWQEHLALHPLADATSCPRDYGVHDALAHAVSIADGRAEVGNPT